MDIRKGNLLANPFQRFTQSVKLISIGAIVLSFIFLLNEIRLSHYFPIKTVRVYGVNRIDHDEIETLLMPLVDKGFFTVNVDYIRDRLQQIPWVSNIFVRRNWPDQVDITVIEKKPVANWNHESLLSTSGELFTPKLTSYPKYLPTFVGPPGKQIIMLQYFNLMNRLLTPLHAKISYLEMTPYFTWKMTLDTGVTLQVGHKDILTRLDHFVKVYPKIVGNRTAQIDYIDLRYPNGMAVRWRETFKT